MLNEENVILIGFAVAALPEKKTLKRKRGKWVKDLIGRNILTLTYLRKCGYSLTTTVIICE
jgi:hypothetical protein